MRQAGILAEAGIYALENNVQRLAEDHVNALALAEGLVGIDELKIDMATVQTNMVFISVRGPDREPLIEYLKRKGILVGGYGQLRMVTHHDIVARDIPVVVEAIKGFFVKG